MRPADVPTRAHTMVESGPAAGVLAAAHLIRTSLPPDEFMGGYIAFDMGGTSAKASLIRDGRFAVTTDYEIGRGAHESFSVRMSGYPIKSPVIDLIESGHGGGSLAWVDDTGVLKVGPESAGAQPGPACYGRGGELPTVTDCNLVLGRLNPDNFAAGEMRLEPERAREAIEEHLCVHLGTDIEETAAAVLRVVNAIMARSIRVVSVQQGVDPRTLTLIAFGGAGPLHAAELGIPKVIVPTEPGVFSAAGLVRGDLRMDFSQACALDCEEQDEAELARIFASLEERGRAWLREAGGGSGTLVRQADARYRGQSHTLTVTVGDTDSGRLGGAVHRAFEREHARQFGFDYPGSPVEVVVCRLTGSVAPDGRVIAGPARAAAVTARPEALRSIYFPTVGFVEARVLDRLALAPGEEVVGPAIIEERTSAVLVPPGSRCSVAEGGMLRMEVTLSEADMPALSRGDV